MSRKISGAMILALVWGVVPIKVAFAGAPSLINVTDYGVDMTGAADSTVALNHAISAAESTGGAVLTAPCGTIRTTSTITVTASLHFSGSGSCTTIKYDASAGSAAAPIIDVTAAASGTVLENFSFNQQANLKSYAVPTGNPIFGTAILLESDSSAIRNVYGYYAYDNCISVAQMANSAAVPGKPQFYSIEHVRTSFCGLGSHTGAGIDVASGSVGVVNDLVDNQSYSGLILDIGAGAQGQFSNISAFYTAYDPAVSGSGYSFYIGSSYSQFSNLVSVNSSYRGLWLDGYATNTLISNLTIKAPAREGVYIKGGNSSLTNIIVDSPGYPNYNGTIDAILIDSSALAISGLNIVNPSIRSSFTMPRYAVNQVGANSLSGAVIGGNLIGFTAATNLPGTVSVIDQMAGASWTSYTPSLSCQSGNLGSSTPTGFWSKLGKTVSIRINVPLANVGTCSGSLFVSVPFVARDRSAIMGLESALFGKQVVGLIYNGTDTLQAKFYDGSFSIQNGELFTLGGSYETQ